MKDDLSLPQLTKYALPKDSHKDFQEIPFQKNHEKAKVVVCGNLAICRPPLQNNQYLFSKKYKS